MAGESTFPAVIDTDDILYRVDTDDLLVPAMLNNKTDALETIEIVMGATDDGSGAGGDPAATTGLAHYTGFFSTGMANPRYPWFPVPSNAWYASQGTPPAAWTITGNLTVAYDKPVGVARLAVAQVTNTVLATVDLAGSTPWDVIMRVRCQRADLGQYALGFSATGVLADLEGVYIRFIYGAGFALDGVVAGTVVTNKPIAGCYSPFGYVRTRLGDGQLRAWFSPDGICWGDPAVAWSTSLTPTKFVIAALTGMTAPGKLWLDFWTQGNTDPAGE